MNAVVETEKTKEITEYNPFRAQLAELRVNNATLVFDYASPKGNKEARSYVYKLRQTRAGVDKARAAVKADVLRKGRLIDSEAAEIMGEISAMIEVHQKPLDEIEQKEKERQAKYQGIVDELFEVAQNHPADLGADAIADRMREVESITIDESFAEYEEPAKNAKLMALTRLESELKRARQREQEAEELARLRAEAAERTRKEHEERIAREAAEKARAEADAKAKAETEAARKAVEEAERRGREMAEAAAKREQEAKIQAEIAARQAEEQRQRAERAAAEAKEQAERAAAAAEERVKREAEEKARREAEEQAKREKDREHRGRINREAKESFVTLGYSEEQAVDMVTVIAQGRVKHISITY